MFAIPLFGTLAVQRFSTGDTSASEKSASLEVSVPKGFIFLDPVHAILSRIFYELTLRAEQRLFKDRSRPPVTIIPSNCTGLYSGFHYPRV